MHPYGLCSLTEDRTCRCRERPGVGRGVSLVGGCGRRAHQHYSTLGPILQASGETLEPRQAVGSQAKLLGRQYHSFQRSSRRLKILAGPICFCIIGPGRDRHCIRRTWYYNNELNLCKMALNIPFALIALVGGIFLVWLGQRVSSRRRFEGLPRVGIDPGFLGLWTRAAKDEFFARGQQLLDKGYAEVRSNPFSTHLELWMDTVVR
jgi:hypothetical protein